MGEKVKKKHSKAENDHHLSERVYHRRQPQVFCCIVLSQLSKTIIGCTYMRCCCTQHTFCFIIIQIVKVLIWKIGCVSN